jgi:hypothetical protein
MHRGDQHKGIAAGIADQRLDVPLLVGSTHQAEVRLEEVMTLEPLERVGQFAVATPTIFATATLELS